MTKELIEKADPNKGARRIVATKPMVKDNPHLSDLLSLIGAHKPSTGILKEVDRIAKAKGENAIINLVRINKAQAMDLLTRNFKDNRRITWGRVEKYATLMKKKKWTYNGETIQISVDGELLNGQHRLLAIILSDTEQTYHLEGGFTMETMKTLDTGFARTAADVMKMKGIEVHAETLAAAIKKYLYWKQTGRVVGSISGAKIDNQAVIDWIETGDSKRMASYCEIAIRVFKFENPYFTAAEWTFLYFILSTTGRNRKDQADAFITSLTSGKGMSDRGKTSPIYHCFRLMRSWDRGKYSEANQQYQKSLKFKFLIAYWNAYISENRGNMDVEKGIKLTKEQLDSPLVPEPL